MISNTKHQKLVLIITVSLFLLNSVFAQDLLTKAKSLIVEKKYDLAIEQYKKAILVKPNNILSIADSCYVESSKLLKNGNRPEAKKLFDYACSTLQSHSQSFTNNFYTYLELINDNDSIFDIISRLYPNYFNLKRQLMKTNLSCLKTNSGYMYKIKDGYCDQLWLIPTGSTEFNEKHFGISSFSPITSNVITNIELEDINSITPTAIIRSVKEDQLFLTENWSTRLRISLIPELSDLFAQMIDKTDFQIAAEKDRIVKGIKNLREKYLVANLKYIFSKFQISGKCYAYKRNYDFNSQQIDLHLSISDQTGEGIYIATLRVPLSLEDAQIFFENGDSYFVDVPFNVSPGIERKGLGISGGGVSRWSMPNLYMVEEPTITFAFPKKVFTFETSGLQGELWSSVETRRWDLNEVDRPYNGRDNGGSLVRIIKGTPKTFTIVNNTDLKELKEGENFLRGKIGKSNEGNVGLNLGNKAPEISEKNVDGKEINLSSLQGKLVLIEFWASWCMPCRRENPNLVATYEKYKDFKFKYGNGFTVFSVSLDRDKTAWLEAIKNDNLKWENHVSDLQMWNSKSAAIYGIKSIPSNLLLDSEGIIVGKDLNGQALIEALELLITKSIDISQSSTNYEGTYLVTGNDTFDEGKLVFKVSNSKLIGLCEQGVNPMGGLAKRKYEATAIDSNGSGDYIYSYAIYNRQGELLQENKVAAKGKIYFMNDRVKIGDEIFLKMK